MKTLKLMEITTSQYKNKIEHLKKKKKRVENENSEILKEQKYV